MTAHAREKPWAVFDCPNCDETIVADTTTSQGCPYCPQWLAFSTDTDLKLDRPDVSLVDVDATNRYAQKESAEGARDGVGTDYLVVRCPNHENHNDSRVDWPQIVHETEGGIDGESPVRCQHCIADASYPLSEYDVLASFPTEDDARAFCKEYVTNHDENTDGERTDSDEEVSDDRSESSESNDRDANAEKAQLAASAASPPTTSPTSNSASISASSSVNTSTAKYTLTWCPETRCHAALIIKNFHSRDRVTCPICGSGHNRNRFKVVHTADTRDEIAEVRSRELATQWDDGTETPNQDAYTRIRNNIGPYRAQATAAQNASERIREHPNQAIIDALVRDAELKHPNQAIIEAMLRDAEPDDPQRARMERIHPQQDRIDDWVSDHMEEPVTKELIDPVLAAELREFDPLQPNTNCLPLDAKVANAKMEGWMKNYTYQSPRGMATLDDPDPTPDADAELRSRENGNKADRKGLCAGTTTDGSPCQNLASNNGYCHCHAPNDEDDNPDSQTGAETGPDDSPPVPTHPGTFTITPVDNANQVDIPDADILIQLDGENPPTDIATTVLEHEQFKTALVDGLESLLAGLPQYQRAQLLYDAGIAENPTAWEDFGETEQERASEAERSQQRFTLVNKLLELAKYAAYPDRNRPRNADTPDSAEACYNELLDERFSKNSFRDIRLVTRLLTLFADTPSFGVVLSQGFWERRCNQRLDILWFIQRLADGCEVELVGSRVDCSSVVTEHGSVFDLSAVDEHVFPHHPQTDLEERVRWGHEHLDRDHSKVKILEVLREAAGSGLSYADIAEQVPDITASTIRDHVNDMAAKPDEDGDADEITLRYVRTYRDGVTKIVRLLEAGKRLLERLDEEDALQRKLGDFVDAAPDTVENNCGKTRAPSLSSASRSSNQTPVEMARAEAAAAQAVTTDDWISVVDQPVEEPANTGQTEVFCDRDSDSLVVAVYPNRYANTTLVGSATASSADTVFADLLDDGTRLADDENFMNLWENHRDWLRSKRGLGWLSDDLSTPADYLNILRDKRDELQARWERRYSLPDDPEVKSGYHQQLAEDALGLFGSVVGLLSLVDIDIVCEWKLPNYSRDRDNALETTLRTTLKDLVPKVSHAGLATVERILFETDDTERQRVGDIDIDYDDPFASMSASFVLVGEFNSLHDEFRESLREAMTERDVHPDAPELPLEVSVGDGSGRDVFDAFVSRMATWQNRVPDAESTAMLRLFTETPFAIMTAFETLESASQCRRLRLTDVRRILREVPWRDLVPDLNQCDKNTQTTPQKVVAVLLAADERLSVSELREEAGISWDAWADNQDALVASGVIAHDVDGVRVSLPFLDEDVDEDGDVIPWFVLHREESSAASAIDVVTHLLRVYPPDERVRERVATALAGPPDWEAAQEAWALLDAIIDTLREVVVRREPVGARRAEPVLIGEMPDQVSLQESVAGAVAD